MGIVKDGYRDHVTMPGEKPQPVDPVSKMNRSQRRMAMKKTGMSWRDAGKLAKDREQEALRDGAMSAVGAADPQTEEEARRALGEWAARGGR